MTDLLLIETGNGGDLVLRGNDLVKIYGYENAPYLAMFGGASWWGNFMTQQPFLSQTESILKTTTLNSGGRITIERAIDADLSFLRNISGTTWTVSTAITDANRLKITIDINGQQFNYEWNPDTLFLTYHV